MTASAVTAGAEEACCTQNDSADAYVGSTEAPSMGDLAKMRRSEPLAIYGGNPGESSTIDRCNSSACMCIPCV